MQDGTTRQVLDALIRHERLAVEHGLLRIGARRSRRCADEFAAELRKLGQLAVVNELARGGSAPTRRAERVPSGRVARIVNCVSG